MSGAALPARPRLLEAREASSGLSRRETSWGGVFGVASSTQIRLPSPTTSPRPCWSAVPRWTVWRPSSPRRSPSVAGPGAGPVARRIVAAEVDHAAAGLLGGLGDWSFGMGYGLGRWRLAKEAEDAVCRRFVHLLRKRKGSVDKYRILWDGFA
eukprot:scaffold1166_cov261-Pinguiococcus_pyrenoidosus.AAC.35